MSEGAHVPTVEPMEPAIRGGAAQFRATCSCGWKSSRRSAKRGDAQADALEHTTGRPPKMKPKTDRGGWPSGN